MTWTVHPARDNIKKTILSLIFIVTFLGLVIAFYGILWGFLGFIFLFASLHSYYLPTKYTINEEYVEIKGLFITQKRNLKEFRKVYYGRNGILLSPFRHKTFLNHFRGVFLLLPRENKEIIGYVQNQLTPKIEEEK